MVLLLWCLLLLGSESLDGSSVERPRPYLISGERNCWPWPLGTGGIVAKAWSGWMCGFAWFADLKCSLDWGYPWISQKSMGLAYYKFIRTSGYF